MHTTTVGRPSVERSFRAPKYERPPYLLQVGRTNPKVHFKVLPRYFRPTRFVGEPGKQPVQDIAASFIHTRPSTARSSSSRRNASPRNSPSDSLPKQRSRTPRQNGMLDHPPSKGGILEQKYKRSGTKSTSAFSTFGGPSTAMLRANSIAEKALRARRHMAVEESSSTADTGPVRRDAALAGTATNLLSNSEPVAKACKKGNWKGAEELILAASGRDRAKIAAFVNRFVHGSLAIPFHFLLQLHRSTDLHKNDKTTQVDYDLYVYFPENIIYCYFLSCGYSLCNM